MCSDYVLRAPLSALPVIISIINIAVINARLSGIDMMEGTTPCSQALPVENFPCRRKSVSFAFISRIHHNLIRRISISVTIVFEQRKDSQAFIHVAKKELTLRGSKNDKIDKVEIRTMRK